jgi:hypothetical protein
MSRFPARIHALLARDVPVAVVLRRGPADAVCSLLWDRTNDSFELGQWVRARIYERRCDLSPDGRHLIYFHRKSHGSWTVVSRAPWLRGIAVWNKGDCWQGGGLFTSNRTYWLNGCHCSGNTSNEVEPDPAYRPAAHYGGECPGVYYVRLQRDGWALKERERGFAIFEKPLAGGWLIRKYAHEQVGPPQGKGCYWDEHELEHAGCQRRLAFPNWEWAEADRGGLVWAERGCLFRAGLEAAGPGPARLLRDFNGMSFELRTAPYQTSRRPTS